MIGLVRYLRRSGFGRNFDYTLSVCCIMAVVLVVCCMLGYLVSRP